LQSEEKVKLLSKITQNDDLYRGGFSSASKRLADLEEKVKLMQSHIDKIETQLSKNPFTRDNFRPRQSLDAI
jgi:predicted  nucleic acid-binding Zn-ribbon protein